MPKQRYLNQLAAWYMVVRACEEDNRPIEVGGEWDSINPRVEQLPDMPIGKVDHAVFELVHLNRLAATARVLGMEPGFYSIIRSGPDAEYVNVLRWELRGEDNDHCPETCKACRLSCGCGCGCKGGDGVEAQDHEPTTFDPAKHEYRVGDRVIPAITSRNRGEGSKSWGKNVTTFTIDPYVDVIYTNMNPDGSKTFRIEWGDKNVF
jgi:hypothetical protein